MKLPTAEQVEKLISAIDWSTAKNLVPEIHTALDQFASILAPSDAGKELEALKKRDPADYGWAQDRKELIDLACRLVARIAVLEGLLSKWQSAFEDEVGKREQVEAAQEPPRYTVKLLDDKLAPMQVRFVSRHNIHDKPTEANPSPIRVLLVGDIERAQPTGIAFNAAPPAPARQVMAPVEPTEAMLDAFIKVRDWLETNEGTAYKVQASADNAIGEPYWKAMLAAARKG